MENKHLQFPITEKEAKESNISNRFQLNKNAEFPKRLHKLRQEANISQLDLANAIGVTKSTISLYEQGDSVPDVKTLVKIADFYKVSCNYLLLKTDNPTDIPLDVQHSIKLGYATDYDELNDYIKDFINALGAFAILPKDEKQEFDKLINHFIKIIRMCNTIVSNLILIDHEIALDEFHHAAAQMIQICGKMIDAAYQKKLKFYPEKRIKIRISSNPKKDGENNGDKN